MARDTQKLQMGATLRWCLFGQLCVRWPQHSLDSCRRRPHACALTRVAAPAATMVGLVVAINLSNRRLFHGIMGWRVVYFAAAALGLLTALVAALFISEPRHAQRAAGQDPGVDPFRSPRTDPGGRACARRPRASCGAALRFGREFGGHMWAVAKTPSFLVILVEHISSLTRGASGYQVLYLQARCTSGRVGAPWARWRACM